MKLLADENFPVTPYNILKGLGYDIIHIGNTNPSIEDKDVMTIAITEERLILIFDTDYGTLVFSFGYKPLGVIFFKQDHPSPDFPALIVHNYLQSNKIQFVGFYYHRKRKHQTATNSANKCQIT